MSFITSFLTGGGDRPEDNPQEKSLGGFANNVLGGIGDLIGGLAALPQLASDVVQNPSHIDDYGKMILEDYGRRYGGGLDNIAEGLYQEPVSYLGDAADLLGIGLAGKAAKAGIASRLARGELPDGDIDEADMILGQLDEMDPFLGEEVPDSPPPPPEVELELEAQAREQGAFEDIVGGMEADPREALIREAEQAHRAAKENFDPYTDQREMWDNYHETKRRLGEVDPEHPLAYGPPPEGWQPSTPGGYWDDGREWLSNTGPDSDDGMGWLTHRPDKDIPETMEDLQARFEAAGFTREPTVEDVARYNDAVLGAYREGFTHADAAVEVGFSRAFGPEFGRDPLETEQYFRNFMGVFGNGHGTADELPSQLQQLDSLNEQGDFGAPADPADAAIGQFWERIGQVELDPSMEGALTEFVTGLQAVVPPEILAELGRYNLTLDEWADMATRSFAYRDAGASPQEAIVTAVNEWFLGVAQGRQRFEGADPA